MTPVIVFPDVELWVCGYLRAALNPDFDVFADDFDDTYGVYVGLLTPNPRRAEMVTVRRDGGPRLDSVREVARLGINAWAETEKDAFDLAARTRAYLGAAAGSGPILRVVELSGPSAIPDEQPRRFFTVELTVRGTDL